MNSLPRPSPSLRASTVPPCISTSVFTSVRPMPSPSRERSSDVIDLREHLEEARQLLGGDADAVVAHPDHRLLGLRCSTVSQT